MDVIDDPIEIQVRRFLHYWLFGNLAGAAAYGITLTLSAKCLLLLAKSNTTSKRTRQVMMGLVCCMCAVSTTSIVLSCGGVLRWASNPSLVDKYVFPEIAVFWSRPYSVMEQLLLILATWFSDGFMIWRCIMLYDGVSSVLRGYILSFVGLLTSASIAAGLCSIIAPFPLRGRIYSFLSLFALISLVVNGSISSLIVLRIQYHQRFLRRVFGSEYGSAYTKLMTMLIESAAMTLTLSFSHIVIAASKGKPTVMQSPINMVIMKLMTQINAISPILIIFRVAQNRTWQTDPTKMMMSEQDDGHELRSIPRIQFSDSESSPITSDVSPSIHSEIPSTITRSASDDESRRLSISSHQPSEKATPLI